MGLYLWLSALRLVLSILLLLLFGDTCILILFVYYFIFPVVYPFKEEVTTLQVVQWQPDSMV